MKFLVVAATVAFSFLSASAQETKPVPSKTRPRVIVSSPTPVPSSPRVVVSSPIPAPTSPRVIVVTSNTNAAPMPTPAATPVQTQINAVPGILTLGQIKQKLSEAKREMSARPITIAMSDAVGPTSPLEMVRVAFYDRKTRQLDYLTLTKDAFLTKNSEYLLSTTALKMVKLRIIRPNGVNTPVGITDLDGTINIPLMVQYPVVRNGIYYETAYYMSTHPGLVTPEVINAGKLYVRSTIDAARTALQKRGLNISARAADIAERLCVVEHVDHYRFRTEYHQNIYNDVFTLFALNEGQTYRYSVSSAGAGGMVQMIPSTYRMIRNRFPGANLMPDFVGGMQNHANAAQAMLLYIQSTYDDLLLSPTINGALENGIANEFELLSAGYNSNPAKLAGYIKRGGSNWRNLIPRETQIYLQINASLDRFVPLMPRTR